MLDVDYRPRWDPAKPPVRPKNPTRYKAFLYACAKVAAISDGKMKDPLAEMGGR